MDSGISAFDISRAYNMISLAKKAGKIRSGEFQALEAVEKNKAKLLILAEDASDNTKKRFSDKCSHRSIPLMVFGTREKLGKVTGTGERSSVAVTDEGFADALTRLITAKGVTNG